MFILSLWDKQVSTEEGSATQLPSLVKCNYYLIINIIIYNIYN